MTIAETRSLDLAARRRQLGLSQVRLAELLGVRQQLISRWETGVIEIQHPVILDRALRDVARELDRPL